VGDHPLYDGSRSVGEKLRHSESIRYVLICARCRHTDWPFQTSEMSPITSMTNVCAVYSSARTRSATYSAMRANEYALNSGGIIALIRHLPGIHVIFRGMEDEGKWEGPFEPGDPNGPTLTSAASVGPWSSVQIHVALAGERQGLARSRAMPPFGLNLSRRDYNCHGRFAC
jgi:hypothetical protein